MLFGCIGPGSVALSVAGIHSPEEVALHLPAELLVCNDIFAVSSKIKNEEQKSSQVQSVAAIIDDIALLSQKRRHDISARRVRPVSPATDTPAAATLMEAGFVL